MAGQNIILLSLVVCVAVSVHADAPEKVVGGHDAKPGQFPFIVSLKEWGGHVCGGSLISPKHVLTAAHCVVGEAMENYEMLTVGGGSIFKDENNRIHKVKHIKVHEWYMPHSELSYVNDVAVITLEEPVQLDKYQYPIHIAHRDDFDGKTGVVLGWGRIGVDKGSSPILQYTPMGILNHESCQKKVGHYVFKAHVCGLLKSGVGICSGDSGGPLVYNNEVIGIASFVAPCALNIPDSYTNVYQHREWIFQAMKEQP